MSDDFLSRMLGPRADAFLDGFNSAMKDKATPKSESPALPQINAKRFDGIWYVRADDVAAALEATGAKTNERLITKLRKLHER